MPRLTIGTTPVQVAWHNPKRRMLSVEFQPSSIESGNTGLVFGKWGSAPKADKNSNTWDFMLSAGSSTGTNTDELLAEAPIKKDLWLVSDTADQVINITERNIGE